MAESDGSPLTQQSSSEMLASPPGSTFPPGATSAQMESYWQRRKRQVAARKRGPFVRDTATDSELPARAKAVAYRLLIKEVPEEQMSAHYLLDFREYVDKLLDGVKAKDTAESRQLRAEDRELDDAVKGQDWWDLPRVEKWLSQHVRTWAAPVKQQVTSAGRVQRFVSTSSYAAKGTRKTMEDYHCTYLHWPNYWGTPGAAKLPLCTTAEELPGQRKDEPNGETVAPPQPPSLRPEVHQKSDAPVQQPAPDTLRWMNESARFLGIFDGHNGADCAAYARDNLPQRIFSDASFPGDIEQACIRAFQGVHKDFVKRADQVECDAGTTALVAFSWGARVYLASVGDCGAVLVKNNGGSKQLTHPHLASDPVEAAAVQERGGVIRTINGKDRVDGVVCITRGMGCRQFAHHTSSLPDVLSFDITPQDEFLLLASDGLWDVMTPSQAADLVREYQKEADAAPPPAPSLHKYSGIAEKVCLDAIAKCQTQDNVTVTIMFFNH
ncbi:putative protein phosphatase 2C 54 [Diplonema papillatum]|nr:putative protein phosphatase 2C 54 [Diplonema papillatum]